VAWPGFVQLVKVEVVAAMESGGDCVVDFVCNAGRHRSVASAEILGKVAGVDVEHWRGKNLCGCRDCQGPVEVLEITMDVWTQ